MKVILAFTVVFFMFLKRSVSGASFPHIAGVTLFPLPYGTLPPLPGGTLPSLPDDTLPSLPGGTLFPLPYGTLPSLPGGTLPSLPGGTLFPLPYGTLPSLPGGTLPPLPGGTLPSLADDASPHYLDAPNLPSLVDDASPHLLDGPGLQSLSTLPNDTLPSNLNGPLHISPDGASDDDSSIPAIAGVLFTAVSKANEFPIVSAQPITDAQRCVNAYNTSTFIDIANAGVDILQAVSMSGHGIHIGLANQLQEQFVANISRCSVLEALDNRFNCYVLQISNLLQSIATANNGSGFVHRLKTFVVLRRLAKDLDKKYERLQQCLSLVLQSTTPELQTTSESILSVLNTVLPSVS